MKVSERGRRIYKVHDERLSRAIDRWTADGIEELPEKALLNTRSGIRLLFHTHRGWMRYYEVLRIERQTYSRIVKSVGQLGGELDEIEHLSSRIRARLRRLGTVLLQIIGENEADRISQEDLKEAVRSFDKRIMAYCERLVDVPKDPRVILNAKQQSSLLGHRFYNLFLSDLLAAGVAEKTARRKAREAIRIAGIRVPYAAGKEDQALRLHKLLGWGGRPPRPSAAARKALEAWEEVFRLNWSKFVAAREDPSLVPAIVGRIVEPLSKYVGRKLPKDERLKLVRLMRNGASTPRSLAIYCVGLKEPLSARSLRRLAKTLPRTDEEVLAAQID